MSRPRGPYDTVRLAPGPAYEPRIVRVVTSGIGSVAYIDSDPPEDAKEFPPQQRLAEVGTITSVQSHYIHPEEARSADGSGTAVSSPEAVDFLVTTSAEVRTRGGVMTVSYTHLTLPTTPYV